MSAQQTATIVLTIRAAADIEERRFVGWNDQTAGAGAAIKGVSDHRIALGDNGKLNYGPTSMVDSGAAIDGTETRLMSDSQGRAIPWTTGNVVAARLKTGQTATATGQAIEVFPLQS
jgi:hypothetical protein